MIAALVLLAALGPVEAQGDVPAIFTHTIEEIAREARARGIGEPAVARLEAASYLPDVVARLERQPEFALDPTVYLRRVVSEERVALARKAYERRRDLLARLEERYGVPGDILVSIWGVESGFGAVKGGFEPVSALATLAAGTRRADFGREQLLALLAIIDAGHAPAGALDSSWAGAMGQTQFIPTTYRRHAQDFDGDGDRDIWNDVGDALASAAALLKTAGWRTGAPVMVEASGTDGAEWLEGAHPPARWAAAGWRSVEGGAVSEADWGPGARLSLLAPAGGEGPVFFTAENFRALLAYNRSDLYASAVALIARAAAGASPAPEKPWPQPEAPLSAAEIEELQAGLARLGFDVGAADGRVGPRTRAAVRAFQRSLGAAPDGRVDRGVYEAVASGSGGG